MIHNLSGFERGFRLDSSMTENDPQILIIFCRYIGESENEAEEQFEERNEAMTVKDGCGLYSTTRRKTQKEHKRQLLKFRTVG